MEVEFDDPDLDDLETNARYEGRYSQGVVRAYRKRLQSIRAAADERDLYAMKSNHFEKLKGNRSHQHSMRLNNQWRLIIEIRGRSPKKRIAICSIEDYH